MADEPEESLSDLTGDEPTVEAPKPRGRPKAEAKVEAEPEERLHPILSNEQVLAAKAKAREKIDKERVAAAMKAVQEEETSRLRFDEGLTSGITEMDEIVDVTVDLPPFTQCISINGPRGRHFWHGRTYALPRHVANSLNEQMFRAWQHEDQVEGRDIKQQYGRKRDSVINARTGAVHNAPARFDA